MDQIIHHLCYLSVKKLNNIFILLIILGCAKYPSVTSFKNVYIYTSDEDKFLIEDIINNELFDFEYYTPEGQKKYTPIWESPEEFIKVDNGKISSFPMKGTRPEGSNELERQKYISELANSEKDKAEHLMIVDLLRNDLGKICKFGTVKIKNLYGIQTYETVHHMVTEVYGEIQDSTNFTKIINALFPGGSITGAPKQRAIEIIDDIEKYSRGIYTGSMGIISNTGDMIFNIAIRTLSLKDNLIKYPVGGGIVWDSDPDEERMEAIQKSKILSI